MNHNSLLESNSGIPSRRALVLTAIAVVCIVGLALAQHAGKGQVKVRQLSQRPITEKLDGKEASVTVSEVTFEPGQEDRSHRHAGPVFGYVLEGEYEHALDAQPIKVYRAGETFYEPSGSLHRVARNPNSRTRTRLLAVILHARDAKEVTIAHPSQEQP